MIALQVSPPGAPHAGAAGSADSKGTPNFSTRNWTLKFVMFVKGRKVKLTLRNQFFTSISCYRPPPEIKPPVVTAEEWDWRLLLPILGLARAQAPPHQIPTS